MDAPDDMHSTILPPPTPPIRTRLGVELPADQELLVRATGTDAGSFSSERRPDLGASLAKILTTPGVVGAMLVQDGDCLAHRLPEDFERRLDEMVNRLSTAVDGAKGDSHLFSFGAHYLVGRQAGSITVFAIIGRDANLGMVKVGLRMLARKLAKAVTQRPKTDVVKLDETQRLRQLLHVVHRGLVSCRAVLAPVPGLGQRHDARTLAVLDDVCAKLVGPDVQHDYEVDIARSFVELAQQVTILQKDLSRAAEIQQSLLPTAEAQDSSIVDLATIYRPEGHCGGDWWTVRQLDEHRLLVAIADVTGHGAAAAMVTGIVDAACHDIAQTVTTNHCCSALLTKMNRMLRAAFGQSVLTTCCIGIIDRAAGTLTVANAGHKFPYLIHDEEGNNELHPIVARGNALGANDDSTYLVVQASIEPGDTILWCTDGVTECTDAASREFGDKRLQRILRTTDLRDGATAMRDRILGAMTDFCGGTPLNDDLTMVVVRIKKP